jgi:CheY-like chemotaxis protein
MAPRQVLIIDDDPGIRKIVQISLKAIAAWHVLSAASGQQGLEVDVQMPGMDGITTLHHLRQTINVQNTPVILLTAKAQLSEQYQFNELPITGIITKPFKAPDLVSQIRLLLNWQN